MDRIFLIFVCIITVFSLSAQSAYLDGTSKSFNVGGALLDTKEQSYFTVAPGFTFGGKWNIGVNIGRGKIKAVIGFEPIEK